MHTDNLKLWIEPLKQNVSGVGKFCIQAITFKREREGDKWPLT